MTDLLLRERDQGAVRAVIALEAVPGVALPGEGVLALLGRLIECDACGIAQLDDTGSAVGADALRPGQDLDDDLSTGDAPVVVGIERRSRRPTGDGVRAARAVAVLTLGVRNGPPHVVKLWMVRRATDFSDRDRALLELVTPALERLLRERPTTNQPSLTVQERRVLPTSPSVCPTPRSRNGWWSLPARCESTSSTPTASSASPTGWLRCTHSMAADVRTPMP